VFTQCVVGYRAWIADSDLLWPIAVRHAPPWQPGVNTAQCRRDAPRLASEAEPACERSPQHVAPDAECRCGLYSLRNLRREWGCWLSIDAGDEWTVVGAVASWGRIEVHRAGFRAEHARVVALAHRPWAGADGAAVHRIAERYGVEVTGLCDLEVAASRYGAPLPDKLHDQIAFE